LGIDPLGAIKAPHGNHKIQGHFGEGNPVSRTTALPVITIPSTPRFEKAKAVEEFPSTPFIEDFAATYLFSTVKILLIHLVKSSNLMCVHCQLLGLQKVLSHQVWKLC